MLLPCKQHVPVVNIITLQWNLLSSSNNFTTYLSAYSVFLSSIAGVIICDYYAVRKGYLDVTQLYRANKRSPYYHVFGFSWHAYASYIAGILINVVGFVGAVGGSVPMGAIYLYRVNYLGGFLVAFAMYYVLTLLFPIPATSKTWSEVREEDQGGVSPPYDDYSTSAEGHFSEKAISADKKQDDRVEYVSAA